jgi:hypothetical protein
VCSGTPSSGASHMAAAMAKPGWGLASCRNLPAGGVWAVVDYIAVGGHGAQVAALLNP